MKTRRTIQKRRKWKIVLCVCALLGVLAAGYFLISGWLAGRPALQYAQNMDTTAGAAYPDARFAVISDLHVYDPSLGSGCAAFETVMQADRKLLLDSIELLEYAIQDILRSDAQFVLISGDLTKDGERVCHEIAADRLARLTDAGLKVYVVPGNHDIDNPEAVSFAGDATAPVDTVSAEEFTRIYADFGYGGALYRDGDSLSYVAEPVDGLWLLALDACRYRENQPGHEPVIGGKISQATADWIADVLSEARHQGKAVMVMAHHGMVEHWDGQRKLHPDYLIHDYAHVGEFLASYNVRLAFTGHYHAQDVTRGVFGDTFLYDVETGSLVTAPCPIRYVSLEDNRFSAETVTVVDKLRPGTDFARISTDFVKATVVSEALKTLSKYNVGGADADVIADAVGDAFAAHYSGDEDPAQRPELDKSRLSLWGRFILFMQQYVLDGLWADLYPADNNVSFTLGSA